jgi:hypothetical protein
VQLGRERLVHVKSADADTASAHAAARMIAGSLAARRRPIRSRARRSPMAPGRASGSASRARRASYATAIPGMSPATSITAMPTTPR